MDRYWGHYAKRNKPVTKQQILLQFHLQEVSIINFTETESKRWLLGAEKGEKEELFKRYRVSVLQDEKALEPVS